MVIFLTGISGLVGSHIAKALLKEGHEIHALLREGSSTLLLKDIEKEIKFIEGDLDNPELLFEALEHTDACIHAAAKVSFNPKDKAQTYKTNYEGTRNLVNAVISSPRCTKLLYVSSISTIDFPIKPGKSADSIPKSMSDYSISKHYGELETFRAKEEGVSISILNPTLVIGPGKWKESTSRIIHYIMEKRSFYSHGIANYVDARDLAVCVVRLLKNLEGPNSLDIQNTRIIINAGRVSFFDLFRAIAHQLGTKAPHRPIPKWVMEIIWRVEYFRSMLFGTRPAVDRVTARQAFNKRSYPITDTFKWHLPDFHSFDDTIEYTVKEFKRIHDLP